MVLINLFSTFDPSTSLNFSINWLRTIYIIILLPMNFWLINSRFNYILIMIFNYLVDEFGIIIKLKLRKFNMFIFISLFYYILLNNFLGIFSYIFTSRRHLIFRVRLSLVLWFRIIIFGWVLNTNHIFIHLVPQGTPGVLIPLIVIIETIRNLIRPLTLSVRLAANIIAGHLLITLISSTGEFLRVYLLLIILSVQILLIILELSVSFIQSYVFTVLTRLYSLEVKYDKNIFTFSFS